MAAPGELMSMPGSARMHTHAVAVMRVILPAAWLLLWLLVSLTEKAVFVHMPGVGVWGPLLLSLISTAVVGAWVIWSLRSGYLERVSLAPPRYWFAHHLHRLPIVIVACVLLVFALRWFGPYIGVDYGRPSTHFMLGLAFYESVKATLFYVLWLALVFGILALSKWREDSERVLGMQKALAEAHLAQLQGQLRPHFLFNALNTVSSLMMTDTSRADRLLAQLGDLLRASLASGQQHAPVALREELALLGKYAEIMQERFDGRVAVEFGVDADTLNVMVPPMLLQPLLENAFKHGVERSTDLVKITVSASRERDSLLLEVHNTGSRLESDAEWSPSNSAARGRGGLAQDADGEDRDGVGIRNCRERLKLLYGTEANLTVENDDTNGVRARVKLPCHPQAR